MLRRRRLSAELREREVVKPLELFFDLVFVLAFTRCTALMAANPTWEGLAQGMLVLAALWWAWTGYAWLTSVIDPEEGSVRLVMFVAMAGVMIAALCVPEAFEDRALAFVVAYAVVRGAHIGLFLLASRDDEGLRHAVWGLATTTAISVGALLGATFLDGFAQGAVWALALLVEGGAAALIRVEGWRLVPGHFAERHDLVVILALGESIVSVGTGAEADLTVAVGVAAVLGVTLAAGLWWTYFDVVALITARRLSRAEPGRERNALARDSYSYLQFPMVAGIVLVALGLEQTLAHVDEHLHVEVAFALLGGVAIYLLAHVALRLRNAHTVNVQRLVLALTLFALVPVATKVDALVALAGVDVLLWVMIAYEMTTYDERRDRLRHGLEPLPGRPYGAEQQR